MKNRKLHILIAGILAAFSIVSCDYLDKQPDDQLDIPAALRTRAILNAGLPTFITASLRSTTMTAPLRWLMT